MADPTQPPSPPSRAALAAVLAQAGEPDCPLLPARLVGLDLPVLTSSGHARGDVVMHDLLLLMPALASLLLLIWAVRVQFVLRQMQRDLGYAPRRRRGSNPPPPGRRPAPSAGPPIKPQPHGGRQLPHWP